MVMLRWFVRTLVFVSRVSTLDESTSTGQLFGRPTGARGGEERPAALRLAAEHFGRVPWRKARISRFRKHQLTRKRALYVSNFDLTPALTSRDGN